MVYKQFKRISNLRKEQIHSLESVCKAADGNVSEVFCDPSLNFTQEEPAFFFATIGNRTVGVLTLFLPGAGSVEISALINPEYRRQGIFTELFRQAKVTIKKLKCKEIVFVAAPGIASTAAVLKKYKAKLMSSEYKMYLPAVPESILSTKVSGNAKLIPATKKDIPMLAHMNAIFFDTSAEFAEEWFKNIVELENVNIFKLIYNGETAGSVCINCDKTSVSIFGVGILPEYRGKGLGRNLMTLVLQTAPSGHSIVLQVSSVNAVAFSLYQKLGFAITAQQDFYKIVK